jgi:hypothetical protein
MLFVLKIHIAFHDFPSVQTTFQLYFSVHRRSGLSVNMQCRQGGGGRSFGSGSSRFHLFQYLGRKKGKDKLSGAIISNWITRHKEGPKIRRIDVCTTLNQTKDKLKIGPLSLVTHISPCAAMTCMKILRQRKSNI